MLSNGVEWNGIVSLVSDVLAVEYASGQMTTRNLFKLFGGMAILHESL